MAELDLSEFELIRMSPDEIEAQHRREERRIRRLAAEHGYLLRKKTHGQYRLIDAADNFLVAGERFDLTLADVERFLIGQRGSA